MAQNEMAELLALHRFFGEFSQRHLQKLAAGAESFTAKAGEHLGKLGEQARRFFLIQEGQVELALYAPERGVVPIQTVGPGDAVGWSWLVPPRQWRFDCRAVTDVKGIAFDSEWLRTQCELDHELGYHFLRQLIAVVAERLAAARVQLLDIYR